MSLKLDTNEIHDAYQQVRNRDDVKWVAFGYTSDTQVGVIGQGEDYNDFIKLCTDDVRVYGFASFLTGDELSKRKKFVFITWVGTGVSPLKKAAVTCQKGDMKKIIQNFAVEVQTNQKDELKASLIEAQLKKAGGADYGRGS